MSERERKVQEMEMKGIIEHSILCEDAEIYRGGVRWRDSERERKILLRDIQSENDSGLNSLPDSALELTAGAVSGWSSSGATG